MAHTPFTLEAFNQRVLNTLQRREARRQAEAPPSLIQRLKDERKAGSKLRTLPRV